MKYYNAPFGTPDPNFVRSKWNMDFIWMNRTWGKKNGGTCLFI